MAQITNISNSADYQSIVRSTASSDDEDYLTPSLDTEPLTNTNDAVDHPYTTIEIDPRDNDSINTDELSQSTTRNLPPYETFLNLSSSSSETSLARPLLNTKHLLLPNYTNDYKLKSPSDPIVSNGCLLTKSYFIDMLISAFLITPFLNIHWRGAWDLLDIYLLPTNARKSALISLGIGLVILYISYLIQNYLKRFHEKYRKHFLGQVLIRAYTLVIALAYINQWRGLWNLLDLTSNHWSHLLIETSISLVALLLMKSVSNLNSAPFIIDIDIDNYFQIASKYLISTNRFWQYTFDFVSYEIVEVPLIVVAWRGLYNLSDLYISPDNKSLSMLISFTIGYLIFFLLAFLQLPIIQCFLTKPHKTIHSFLSNILHLIAFIGVVQIWRSLWMMCEQYINIPDFHHITLWLCYLIPYVILSCGMAVCSLTGETKDTYLENNQPLFLFNFKYASIFFRNQSDPLKARSLQTNSSSTETIMPEEFPYRCQPP